MSITHREVSGNLGLTVNGGLDWGASAHFEQMISLFWRFDMCWRQWVRFHGQKGTSREFVPKRSSGKLKGTDR